MVWESMMITRILTGWCSATWLYFVAGLIYPIAIINETTVAILIVAWLLLPYVVAVVYYWRAMFDKLRQWGIVA